MESCNDIDTMAAATSAEFAHGYLASLLKQYQSKAATGYYTQWQLMQLAHEEVIAHWVDMEKHGR